MTADTSTGAVNTLAMELPEAQWRAPMIFRAADTLRALAAERDAMRAELADANVTIVAFVSVHAVQAAKDLGLPDGHIAPHHYDILQKAGARMDSFTRAALDAKP